jgi:hypothetical protein
MSESWTPETYPAVPPDAKFRQDLQRALEQTHRQQAAQRKLRTRGSARQLILPRQIAGVLLLLLALLITVRWLQGRGKHPYPPL